ncbi:MAG: hypothetical protein AB1449_11305 [Chloroflexota bacterium]
MVSCSGCGMCEEACPDHLPLAAITRRLHLQLVEASSYVACRSLADPLPSWN